MSKKIVYIVFQEEGGEVGIDIEGFSRARTYNSEWLGEFTSFAKAKKLAVDAAKSTVANYEYDLANAKYHLKNIRSLKKPKEL